MSARLCLCWVALQLAIVAGAELPSRPHIVAIIADDFGWANVGYHREPGFKETVTPTIDKLVKEGVELDRHYTFQFCSPSRSSFQSGRLPVHVNAENAEPTLYNPADPVGGYAGIPVNMTGIAQKMKEGGYRTHMTGKWDCGMATERHTPQGRGYDTFFGYFHHANDYWTEGLGLSSTGTVDVCGNKYIDLWDTDRPASHLNGTAYEEVLFENATLEVIHGHNSSVPLFLVHAFHIVHTPLQVPDKYLTNFSFIREPTRKTYAAMVQYMDGVVGRIVTALKVKQMWSNTLLVFTSDNGGPLYATAGANNFPLKGGKYSDWEGGVRTNTFVAGGILPTELAGSKMEGLVSIADWYATFAALAGVGAEDAEAKAVGLPAVDGMNLWPFLSGKSSSPRAELQLSQHALIMGEYKLIMGFQAMSGWPGKFYPTVHDAQFPPAFPEHSNNTKWFDNCHGGCLFNIFEDPSERHDLSVSQPEVLTKMILRLNELNKGLYMPNRGNQTSLACAAAERYGGFYGPFILSGTRAANPSTIVV